jgi:hypothetical protein
MNRAPEGRLSSVETWLLALWLGAALFFAIGVAPAAFAVLPDSALSGALVGRLLPPLFVSGSLLGLAILAIELRLRGSPNRRRAWASAVTLAATVAAPGLSASPRT